MKTTPGGGLNGGVNLPPLPKLFTNTHLNSDNQLLPSPPSAHRPSESELIESALRKINNELFDFSRQQPHTGSSNKSSSAKNNNNCQLPAANISFGSNNYPYSTAVPTTTAVPTHFYTTNNTSTTTNPNNTLPSNLLKPNAYSGFNSFNYASPQSAYFPLGDFSRYAYPTVDANAQVQDLNNYIQQLNQQQNAQFFNPNVPRRFF
jgi:hypothetical protein